MPRSARSATSRATHSNLNVVTGPVLSGNGATSPITRDSNINVVAGSATLGGGTTSLIASHSNINVVAGSATLGDGAMNPTAAPVEHRTPVKKPTIKMSTPELRRSRRIFNLAHGNGRYVIPTENFSLKEVNKKNEKHAAKKSDKRVAKKNTRQH
ncbi:hypothetical protein MJO28_013509 [Puccinia striiformis f. sp. tritici]|uniref:Uncharacterized protein n=3 Tax=Puccinia striiformis TaxID=27350 RepID=A0A0L0V6B3_9BASI|nr:hypothetical protein Pst134EA_026014 [Puccinia striiformis f. sp. tritici]KAI9615242.1 hypothetical protein H4Q26_011785 [Puccinia striiformis f. sp. tritici PST-130]KNE94519.1 hypothetical protein PSTG_12165 [Puccinia striiformis f. sp. tritici PST-78]POW12531.1 hypothetical protein PSHT_08048 [Puccinia striiformis]KAH9444214.1 hypothetical protein Pst134EB_026592 [Puccinia striiformis f. sp. tritici]KAH9452079.1 hypothetical protein Pst134EA_026014 [Puccinia striiformis f. sp. tritici]